MQANLTLGMKYDALLNKIYFIVSIAQMAEQEKFLSPHLQLQVFFSRWRVETCRTFRNSVINFNEL